MTEHPELSPSEISLPMEWESFASDEGGVEFVALEPEDPDEPRFRANLVATSSFVDTDFADWQNAADDLLPDVTDDYLLIDLERCMIADTPGGRRLAHHQGPSGEALTMEQWFVLKGSIGQSLTFTVETSRYDALADVIADSVSTWVPSEGKIL